MQFKKFQGLFVEKTFHWEQTSTMFKVLRLAECCSAEKYLQTATAQSSLGSTVGCAGSFLRSDPMLFSPLYSPCLSVCLFLSVFLLKLSSPCYQKAATQNQDSWIPLFFSPGLTLNLAFSTTSNVCLESEILTVCLVVTRNLKLVRNDITGSCVLIFAIWNKSVTVNMSHISEVHLIKLQIIHLFSLLLVIIL